MNCMNFLYLAYFVFYLYFRQNIIPPLKHVLSSKMHFKTKLHISQFYGVWQTFLHKKFFATPQKTTYLGISAKNSLGGKGDSSKKAAARIIRKMLFWQCLSAIIPTWNWKWSYTCIVSWPNMTMFWHTGVHREIKDFIILHPRDPPRHRPTGPPRTRPRGGVGRYTYIRVSAATGPGKPFRHTKRNI